MTKNKLLILFTIALVVRILFSFLTWHPDVNNHIDWGKRFFSYGARQFYSPDANVWSYTWPNQAPGTIYMFAGVRKLFELVWSILWWININIPLFPSSLISYLELTLYPAMLKLPSILADLGIAYLLFQLLKERKKRDLGVSAALLFLLNPTVWYNSAVWGQTDAVINFLALLSFYLITKRKLILSLVFFGICIYIKLSLLIFAPILVIYAFKSNFSIKEWLLGISTVIVFIWLVTIPFSGINAPEWLYKLYTEKVLVNQMQVITANAFNFWAFLTGIYEQPHTKMLGPIEYQYWGTILFLVIYIPTLIYLYRLKSEDSLWWSLAITAFASFMFMTNMHERYLYPLFPYFTILAVMNRQLLPIYYLVSGVGLANMYHLWWKPRIEILVTLFDLNQRILSRILSFINFGSFIYFVTYGFRLYRKGKL